MTTCEKCKKSACAGCLPDRFTTARYEEQLCRIEKICASVRDGDRGYESAFQIINSITDDFA